MAKYIVVNGKKVRGDNSPSFILRFVGNTLALAVAASLIDSLQIDGLWYLLLSGLVFTVLNSILKPILIILTLPLTLITLGLFYPLINVGILKLLGLIMGEHFIISGIWNAILVSIVVAIVNFAITHLFKKETGVPPQTRTDNDDDYVFVDEN